MLIITNIATVLFKNKVAQNNTEYFIVLLNTVGGSDVGCFFKKSKMFSKNDVDPDYDEY